MSSKMAALGCWKRVAMWQTPWMQVRHRGKVRVRNPREPHFPRKLILEATKPVFPKPSQPDWERCKEISITLKEQPVHPYEQLLAKELMKELKESRLIAFFHRNPITEEEKKKIRNMLFKQNFHLRTYNNSTVRLALRGTPYESILHLITSHNAMVFSPEDHAVKLLQLDKKMPQFILLGGIIDNRLLSREGFRVYSQLPSLKVMQAQVSATLSIASGGRLSTLLNHHQRALFRNLEQYSKK
ncbi:39S ribosomal protein L10, mitochondrial-like [Limulus polyphemus]|uniref:Large ribosomal subunit protein uL10m n=1 Tax=Limulus polyphemus TaxID=6850 RepID=A0ABM1BI12_LIMPO|nr:39S ribosomal protein L10, mitochondrial-like [Limulus polyphemus]XP_013782406.1 39S ribosomal protein L10, mitochondrial-like [Limulus polyphemus]XP_022250904.1 39S ribosomal protein L10, mitochondrial-like [Limulus polyphemus]